jgi:Fe/S biogenesis protein NfuA
MREQLGAERLYVIDISEERTADTAGTIIFGMRKATTPALAARVALAKALEEMIGQPVGVEVYTSPVDELEYLFDQHLRPFIATHGGEVAIVDVDESEKKVWISMDGGCSGCPSSIATLKHGIERTMKKHLPWVDRVESVNEPAEPDFNIALDFSPFTAATKE